MKLRSTGYNRLFFSCICGLIVMSQMACKEVPDNKTKAKETASDCQIYQSTIHKLETQVIESERNADRLEEVMYRLTQNYMVIDQKIRLIEKYQTDSGKDKLLKRTASEINRFFEDSKALLDSVDREIHHSKLSQSSMIPILETVKEYLTYQERLFIEIFGSVGSIRAQVENLKTTVSQQEKEIKAKAKESEKAIELKEKENRKIYYLVGSRKDLQRAKAVKQKGGFLGMGSTLQLSDKLEDMFFQSADFNVMREISLGNTGNVTLITTHPKGTYLVVDTPGEKFLKVTNPQKFWSTSKFLVVEVDE